MNLLRLMLCLCLGMLVGCATPVEIKQALSAKDEHYTENIRLMEQYGQLVQNINGRFQYWYRYIELRNKLNQALKWATSNPNPTDQEKMEIYANQLGEGVRGLVNKIRLKDLPARKKSDGTVLFEAGTGDMNGIIQGLPALIAEVDKQVDVEFKKHTRIDLSPFDEYRANIEVLRRINSMVKGYLDIDVTVQRDDIKEIVNGIKALR